MTRITKAFILVNTNLGAEKKVLMDLRAINGVQEAFMVYGVESRIFTAIRAFDEVKNPLMVYGVYDIIVKLNIQSMNPRRNTILKQIRQIPEIRNILTLIVIENC